MSHVLTQSRWRGLQVIVLRIPLHGGKVCSRKPRAHSLYIFGDCLFSKCATNIWIWRHGTQRAENEACDEEINFNSLQVIFNMLGYNLYFVISYPKRSVTFYLHNFNKRLLRKTFNNIWDWNLGKRKMDLLLLEMSD